MIRPRRDMRRVRSRRIRTPPFAKKVDPTPMKAVISVLSVSGGRVQQDRYRLNPFAGNAFQPLAKATLVPFAAYHKTVS